MALELSKDSRLPTKANMMIYLMDILQTPHLRKVHVIAMAFGPSWCLSAQGPAASMMRRRRLPKGKGKGKVKGKGGGQGEGGREGEGEGFKLGGVTMSVIGVHLM
jgi:hypothetical protein